MSALMVRAEDVEEGVLAAVDAIHRQFAGAES